MKAKLFVERKQSVDEFAAANRKDLERLASYILKRWPAPNAVDVEDVVQELLIECWRKRAKFDAKRGPTPEQYLTFNAVSYAKRFVHRQRGARGDKDLGMFDLLTTTGSVHDSAESAFGGAEMGETELDRRDRLHQLLAECCSVKEAVYLFVFHEEGTIAGAADRVYNDKRLRELCQASSAAQLREAIKRTAKEHAWHG